MKPANFPARKNARRHAALTRVHSAGADSKLTERERNALADRLVLMLEPNPRAIRTKKDRSAHGRFGRL